jgi:uncharacterized C2H2 Zn-finger protein
MQKINCPRCGAKIDNRLDKLADHIFKAHEDDAELCIWVRAEQARLIKPVKQSTTKRLSNAIQIYRGKPVDRIPPGRQEKLPKYLKRQLPQ